MSWFGLVPPLLRTCWASDKKNCDLDGKILATSRFLIGSNDSPRPPNMRDPWKTEVLIAVPSTKKFAEFFVVPPGRE